MTINEILEYEMNLEEQIKSAAADIILNIYNQSTRPHFISENVIFGYEPDALKNTYTKYVTGIGYVNIIIERATQMEIHTTVPISNFMEYFAIAWKNICAKYNSVAYVEGKEYNSYCSEIESSEAYKLIQKGRVYKPKKGKGITYNISMSNNSGFPPLLFSSAGDINTENVRAYGFDYYDRGVWILAL